MFDFYDFFSNADFFAPGTVYREVTRCPVCGLSLSDFKRSGKLGCSECYSTFMNPLSDVLRQVHRNPVHVGKVPGNLKAEFSKKQRLAELKTSLQEAVRAEKYEEAAKLHKEILEIEKG
ncbi:MAG: UvrB/UvrC motif-containing protein [Clostridia bacterium]|nr:UvrB/UvrC motif-containing protein [Clostridia bacterium]